MMRKLLLTLALVASSTAYATEDPDWLPLSEFDNGLKIHGRKGSFERYESSGSMLVRYTNRNSSMTFYIVGITDKDCKSGIGQLVFLDTNWKVVSREAYVSKGGNGFSTMGDTLCYLINKNKGTSL